MTWMIFGALAGLYIGYLGSVKGWTQIRVLATSFIVGAVIGLLSVLFEAQAKADIAFDKLKDATVQVEGLNCSGSGSIVKSKSNKKYILTNNHVCNCVKFKGNVNAFYDDGLMITGKVFKESWASDLCASLIKEDRPALELAPGPSSELRTRGYPQRHVADSVGHTTKLINWSTLFEIGEIGECPEGSKTLRGDNGNIEECELSFVSMGTTLYARPGSSGSPVVNSKGELVGVMSSWDHKDNYSGAMVPYNQLKKFLETL